MTKGEFIDKIKSLEGVPHMNKKQAATLLDGIFNILRESITKEKKFAYPGFGTFYVRERKARKGRNPRTKAEIMIPASKTVTFKPAPTFKSSL